MVGCDLGCICIFWNKEVSIHNERMFKVWTGLTKKLTGEREFVFKVIKQARVLKLFVMKAGDLSEVFPGIRHFCTRSVHEHTQKPTQ